VCVSTRQQEGSGQRMTSAAKEKTGYRRKTGDAERRSDLPEERHVGHRLSVTGAWDIVARHRRAESARSDRHQSVVSKKSIRLLASTKGGGRVMSAGKRMGRGWDGRDSLGSEAAG
jgi:hypothetical protein